MITVYEYMMGKPHVLADYNTMLNEIDKNVYEEIFQFNIKVSSVGAEFSFLAGQINTYLQEFGWTATFTKAYVDDEVTIRIEPIL